MTLSTRLVRIKVMSSSSSWCGFSTQASDHCVALLQHVPGSSHCRRTRFLKRMAATWRTSPAMVSSMDMRSKLTRCPCTWIACALQ